MWGLRRCDLLHLDKGLSQEVRDSFPSYNRVDYKPIASEAFPAFSSWQLKPVKGLTIGVAFEWTQ